MTGCAGEGLDHIGAEGLLAGMVERGLGAVGVGLYWRLARLRVNWQTFPASVDQIQKDRAALEKILA